MRAAPRVSVVAAVFNAGAYLPLSLPRLVGQLEAVDGELILVDDASTDDTVEIATRLVAENARVKIERLVSNGGVARARKHGLTVATGDFVWFVDLDDDWDSALMTTLLAEAARAEADVVVCGACYVYPSGVQKDIHARAPEAYMTNREAVVALLSGRLKGHLWNKLFRRQVALSVDPEPSEVHSDLGMTASFLAASRRVVYIPDVMYRYMSRPGSIINSGRQRTASLEIVERVVRGASSAVGAPPALVEDFSHRFFLLSMIKDSFNESYSRNEGRSIRRRARARISLPVVLSQSVKSDPRRALALMIVKIAPFTAHSIARRM